MQLKGEAGTNEPLPSPSPAGGSQAERGGGRNARAPSTALLQAASACGRPTTTTEEEPLTKREEEGQDDHNSVREEEGDVAYEPGRGGGTRKTFSSPLRSSSPSRPAAVQDIEIREEEKKYSLPLLRNEKMYVYALATYCHLHVVGGRPVFHFFCASGHHGLSNIIACALVRTPLEKSSWCDFHFAFRRTLLPHSPTHSSRQKEKEKKGPICNCGREEATWEVAGGCQLRNC